MKFKDVKVGDGFVGHSAYVANVTWAFVVISYRHVMTPYECIYITILYADSDPSVDTDEHAGAPDDDFLQNTEKML